jgi:hypothetical protein
MFPLYLYKEFHIDSNLNNRNLNKIQSHQKID